MDIDIIIKGGVELEKFYPEKYDSFLNGLSNMVMETFPGVDGCLIETVLTDRHQAENDKREEMRREELKRDLVRLFESDPEFKETIFPRIAEAEDQCPK